MTEEQEPNQEQPQNVTRAVVKKVKQIPGRVRKNVIRKACCRGR